MTPRSNDRERNVCPMHDSFPRLLKALHTAGVAMNVPASCRAAASLAQCPAGQDTSDPLTWSQACATGECLLCPDLPVEAEGGNMAAEVTFQEWKKGQTARLNEKGEPREIFSLHNTTVTLMEGIKLLKIRAKELKKHIFNSYNQWEAKRLCEASLTLGTIMLVDDYQQNLTVELSSTPTSSVYGANQVNVMIFPIVVYYKKSVNEPTKKATITFISDDLSHDHQQVLRMEKRAVEIVKEKTGLQFKKAIRFSDGCGAQFKSRFCVADLCSVPEKVLGSSDGHASYHYFESNEGKSESDTAGSNFKVRVESIILKNPDLVINSSSDLQAAYMKHAPEHTKCYQFCVVEEFPTFQRDKPECRAEVKIIGIRQIHCINYSENGLKASKLSCLSCLKLQEDCESCREQAYTVTSDKLAKSLSGPQEQGESREEQGREEVIYESYGNEDILEKSDDEGDIDQESDNGEDEDEVGAGNIVWGLRYGKRAPAKVVTLVSIQYIQLFHPGGKSRGSSRGEEKGHKVTKGVTSSLFPFQNIH